LRAPPGLLAVGLIAVAPHAFVQEARPAATVFPSGPTVPENLLRIELRFSAPLRVPFSTDYVKLIDNSRGREIERAFLDLPLPSADESRVTILMAPSRVKSGLAENRILGRALRRGASVTLVVDDPELGGRIYKTWRITRSEVDPPRPLSWSLDLPDRGTLQPLVIHLHAPLSSTAEDLIAIRAPDRLRAPGVGRFEDGERVWRFTPDQPWRAGEYAVVTRPDLEDPAGNRPCGPFEAVAASRVGCEAETVRAFRPKETS
jgi:hypothetical protein